MDQSFSRSRRVLGLLGICFYLCVPSAHAELRSPCSRDTASKAASALPECEAFFAATETVLKDDLTHKFEAIQEGFDPADLNPDNPERPSVATTPKKLEYACNPLATELQNRQPETQVTEKTGRSCGPYADMSAGGGCWVSINLGFTRIRFPTCMQARLVTRNAKAEAGFYAGLSHVYLRERAMKQVIREMREGTLSEGPVFRNNPLVQQYEQLYARVSAIKVTRDQAERCGKEIAGAPTPSGTPARSQTQLMCYSTEAARRLAEFFQRLMMARTAEYMYLASSALQTRVENPNLAQQIFNECVNASGSEYIMDCYKRNYPQRIGALAREAADQQIGELP